MIQKITLSIFSFVLSLNTLSAQPGCTDPAANNYNPLATGNNGSCTYDVTTMNCNTKGPVFSYAGESSGIVFTDGFIWTHNDSGNSSDIFKIDSANGSLLQKVSVTNFPNNDWEDITADSNYIYVGDFGNNNGTRMDLKVLKIAKSQLTGTAAVIGATAQAINFSYADQTSFTSNSSNNYDCESVISIGSSLYLFTKDRGDFQTRVYRLSKTPGTYTVSPYTSYNVNGKITGADYNKQKNEVALIGYMASNKNSFVYLLNDFSGDLFFSGNKRRIEIGNSTNDWQTEGICYGASPNELFISCESSYTTATLYNAFKASMAIVGLTEVEQKSKHVKIYPNPASGLVNIESAEMIQKIEVFAIDGKLVYSKQPDQSNYHFDTIELNNAVPGYYTVKLQSNENVFVQKLFINPHK